MKRFKLFGVVLAILAFLAFLPVSVMAFTIDSYYASYYAASSLGSITDLPTNYGGLTFKAGDPSTLLIGGSANQAAGKLYSVGLTRNAGNHITGFSGTITSFADAADNDGGLQYGPGGVLFYTLYSDNKIGEFKPGSTAPDKLVDLSPLGVSGSVGGLAFVPSGYPGAGQLKIVSYGGGDWYTAALTADGSGTYDIGAATLNASPGGGPEGIAYVPSGSPRFTTTSVLISEYSTGKVAAYEVDLNGNPVVSSRKDFITGLTGAEGAVIDPLTGDFLFSTFGGENQVIVVQGFNGPPAVPVPPTLLLLGSGLLGLIGFGRKFKRN
jgi:hypothetical protein